MKLISFEDRTIEIAGKRFARQVTTQKVGDMRNVAEGHCKKCEAIKKVISGFTGPGLNTFRIESRCLCGSDVDQIDFSQVHQTIRVHARNKCEEDFLQGLRHMENCCSETTDSKCCTDTVVCGTEKTLIFEGGPAKLIDGITTVTPYDCVCDLTDQQKSRITALGFAFKQLHADIKAWCQEAGKKSASDRCVSEALTNLETAWEFCEKAIKLEGKTVER